MSKLKAAELKRKLDLKQSKLKARLHENCRIYAKYRHLKHAGFRVKAPVLLKNLHKQQTEINAIRKRIAKHPISIVQDMKKTLEFL